MAELWPFCQLKRLDWRWVMLLCPHSRWLLCLLWVAHKGFQRFEALEQTDCWSPNKARAALAPRQRFLYISVLDKKVTKSQQSCIRPSVFGPSVTGETSSAGPPLSDRSSTPFHRSHWFATVSAGDSVQLQLVRGLGCLSEPRAGPPGQVAERQVSRGPLPAQPEDGPLPPLLLLWCAHPRLQAGADLPRPEAPHGEFTKTNNNKMIAATKVHVRVPTTRGRRGRVSEALNCAVAV